MAASEATPRRADPAALVERMLGGDRLALARLITHVENRSVAVPSIMQAIHARARDAYVVGVTGPPGAGKSTVVDRLTALLRAEGETVGIVAVDPSSPFSGGAVLGDRIRMQAHALDPGVFIRSMATRGSLGGLAHATGEVAKLLGAAGYRWVLIETVGVGQTEVGDRDALVRRMDEPRRDMEWETPVLSLQAQHGIGIQELLAEIRRHRAALQGGGAFAARRRERARAELEALLVDAFRGRVDRALHAGRVKAVFDEVVAGARDPYSAAAAILPVISLEPS